MKGELVSKVTILFQNWNLKTPRKDNFCFQILFQFFFFILNETFRFAKLESADFKYGKSFKMTGQNISKQHILFPNLIFLFCVKLFHLGKFQTAHSKYMISNKSFFQISSESFSRKFKFFYFCTKHCISLIPVCWRQKTNFDICARNLPKISCKKFQRKIYFI